jgi:hypothetical protein
MRRSQEMLGGSMTTSPPIVIVILRQQLVIIDYAVLTTLHPIKAKFSSFKSQLLFTFYHTRRSGAPPWKIILHIIDFEKIVKALVASCRSLSNTCQFSLQSHEAWLTVGKAKILGVRLTKRLSKYLKIQMRKRIELRLTWVADRAVKCIRLTKGSYVWATKLHKKYRVFILHTPSSLQYANTIFLRETKYFITLHIFCRSQTSSSSTTWVYVRLQVSEHRLGGYSHRERWSRTR